MSDVVAHDMRQDTEWDALVNLVDAIIKRMERTHEWNETRKVWVERANPANFIEPHDVARFIGFVPVT